VGQQFLPFYNFPVRAEPWIYHVYPFTVVKSSPVVSSMAIAFLSRPSPFFPDMNGLPFWLPPRALISCAFLV